MLHGISLILITLKFALNINHDTVSTPPNSAASDSFTTSSVSRFTTYHFNRLTVEVPLGWKKQQMGGHGDWLGVQFINPYHPNEKEIIIASDCVGCYLPPVSLHSFDMNSVIPTKQVLSSHSEPHKLSVAFTFTTKTDRYQGDGIITATPNKSGYGWVEIFLPQSEQHMARQFINSFQVAPS